MLGVEVLTIGK